MSQRRWFLIVPAVALALAACSGRQQPQADDALSRDLSLAASAQPYQAQQYMSPAEMGYQGQQGYYPQPQGYYPQAYPPRPAQVVYRYPAPAAQRTVSRASSGTVYAPREPVRNTKRDALIGVAAGTIAGAAIGRDAKGALIGAAAGGLLGAIVGHTIDVQH